MSSAGDFPSGGRRQEDDIIVGKNFRCMRERTKKFILGSADANSFKPMKKKIRDETLEDLVSQYKEKKQKINRRTNN